VEISQNFEAFSECMNFKKWPKIVPDQLLVYGIRAL
jgi:hypothetical protein